MDGTKKKRKEKRSDITLILACGTTMAATGVSRPRSVARCAARRSAVMVRNDPECSPISGDRPN